MEAELRQKLYLSALSAAKDGDLSNAAELARHVLELAPDDMDAARLLGICLYQLGDMKEAAELLSVFPELAFDAREAAEKHGATLQTVDELTKKGKARAALRVATNFPHQSIRMLLVRGCLLAGMRQYRRASRLFAGALDIDSGNIPAKRYLAEAAKHNSFF